MEPTFKPIACTKEHQVFFGDLYVGVVYRVKGEGFYFVKRDHIDRVPPTPTPKKFCQIKPTKREAVLLSFGGHINEGKPLPQLHVLKFNREDWTGDQAEVHFNVDEGTFLLDPKGPPYPGQEKFDVEQVEIEPGEVSFAIRVYGENQPWFAVHQIDDVFYASDMGIERQGTHPVEAAAKLIFSLT